MHFSSSLITKFILVLILIYLAQGISSVSPVFTATNFFASGTITPVSSLISSSTPVPSYNVTLTTALLGQTDSNAILSLSSFDCLPSNQFSLNATISNLALSGFTANLLIIGNTYINFLKLNYLSVTWDSSLLPIKLLFYDCFLCTNLSTGSGTRTQTFTNQTLPSSIADATIFRVQSFITGIQFINNKDAFKQINTATQILTNTSYITQTVTTNGNSMLEWVCLGTVIIDTTYVNFVQEITPYKIGLITLDRVTFSIIMSTFPTGYTTMYGINDTMFFGLNSFEMYLGLPYQIIYLHTENLDAIQIGYQSLSSGGLMSYFFLSSRACTNATHLLYSTIDHLCYDSCPVALGTYLSGTVCLPCHYSCSTCSGGLAANCLTCLSTNNRGPLNATSCFCKSGYVQNFVAICPPCSNYIGNCVQCSDQVTCTACVGLLVFNTTSLMCQCPTGTFLVPSTILCTSFPGCITATNPSSGVLCTACDTTQYFYLDNATNTCLCKTYFILNVTTCMDICGDGINPFTNSTTYCDDANILDGDGCNSTCQIQTNYGCFNAPNVLISVCSPARSFTLKYLYAERIIKENAGVFVFSIDPADSMLSWGNFTYYVETTIPHLAIIASYDQSTSLLQLKVYYLQAIEDQTQTISVMLDPYKIWVPQQSFSFTANGVNYDLTYDSSPQTAVYVFYGVLVVSALIVMASVVFTLINYKIAAVELLLSSQFVYLGIIAFSDDNVSLYSLTSLKYLVGFNTLKQFQVDQYNYDVDFLLTSQTFAEFLLNINCMLALLVLVIIIIIPLKINLMYKVHKKNLFTSPEAQQQQLMHEDCVSLKKLSADVKKAQNIIDTYIDRVYFAISLIVLLPIVLFFCIQLGFIGKVGIYQLSAFGSILLSILLLMVDFCFFILVFQDTDKKVKMFNFGSKRLRTYPYRLMIFYFISTCIYTIVMLQNFTFYTLLVLNVLIAVYVIFQNPFEKPSLQFIDSVSKPFISIACLIIIKATSFFNYSMIGLPIGVLVLLFISLIISIIRTIRVKLMRAQAQKKLINGGQMDDQIDGEKNQYLRQTDNSSFDSQKSRKKGQKKNKNALLDNGSNQMKNGQNNGEINQNSQNLNGDQNNQSGTGLIKENQFEQIEQAMEQDEDQLTKIKRSLRQDLKKRRGVVNKVNQDQSSPKLRKSKSPSSPAKKKLVVGKLFIDVHDQ